MKRILTIIILMAMLIPLKAQVADSATWVVERYLNMLNYDEFPRDTMLYMESIIVNQSYPKDTMVMKRWYAIPHQYRTEVWDHDTIQMGAYGNGTDYFCVYNIEKHHWDEVRQIPFYEVNQAYDFRGPLYDWKKKGAEFEYKGEKRFQGNPVYQVRVQTPGIYDRDYFFEKESGLFFIFNELTSTMGDEELNPERHVDWRACHEYKPLGKMLLPAVESYQANGSVIIIRNYSQLLPYNYNTFNRD